MPTPEWQPLKKQERISMVGFGGGAAGRFAPGMLTSAGSSDRSRTGNEARRRERTSDQTQPLAKSFTRGRERECG